MSFTKRQFVEHALEEIGIAAYVFDSDPEALQNAMHRLDAMVASWNAKGIRVGYPLPSSPELADLDEETNVPDRANEAIITNLAMRLAPSYGKNINPDTRMIARQAYSNLLIDSAKPIEQQLSNTLPRGQGTKPWRSINNEYIDTPVDPLQAGEDSLIDLE